MTSVAVAGLGFTGVICFGSDPHLVIATLFKPWPLPQYISFASIASIALGLLGKYLSISKITKSADSTVARLRDFGKEWSGRFVGLPIGGYEIFNAEQDRQKAFNGQFKRELDMLIGELESKGITLADHEAVRVHKLRKTASLQEPLTAYEWATLMEELSSRLWTPSRWVNRSLVKTVFGYSALFACLWLLLFIVQQHYGSTNIGTVVSKPDRPLGDDALKWTLATQLFDDFHAVKEGHCHVMMIHNDSDYAEDLFNDLQNILTLAGCTTSEQPRDYTLPKGISVCSERTVPARFASRVVTRLDDTAHIKADYEFYGTPDIKCPAMFCPAGHDCFAVTIGNKPGS